MSQKLEIVYCFGFPAMSCMSTKAERLSVISFSWNGS